MTLWMPGRHGESCSTTPARVLLGQRADNGQWGLVTGILEPGEDPRRGWSGRSSKRPGWWPRRERLVAVDAGSDPLSERGVCHFDPGVPVPVRSGVARVNDDESLDVGWFRPEDFPELMPGHLENIRRATTRTASHYRRCHPAPG